MTKSKKWVLGLLAILPLLAQADETTILRLHGSNTIGGKLVPNLAERYLQTLGLENIHRETPRAGETRIVGTDNHGAEVAIEVQAFGSSTGFKSLNSGIADIAMASRPVNDKEERYLSRLGDMRSPASEFVLGLDGIAVIVHPSNPLSLLDKQQVSDIFSGRITNWKQVGGRDAPIHVYARDDRSGTFDTFHHLVMGDRPLATSARRYESNDQLSSDVVMDAQAIGFVGLPSVLKSKALSIADGEALAVAPNQFSVATEDYPLSRRLFLYKAEAPTNPYVEDFLDFALSESGQASVARNGFVAQNIVCGEVHPDREDFPEEYVELTDGARRLSLNFRFVPGTAMLDNKSLKDVDRLVRYLADEADKDQQVMLFGFADSNETLPLHSLELSISRADSVANVLRTKGVIADKVRGYGSDVPVAANDNDEGRAKNRRVEVWVK